jgi:hypothetical protein
VVHRVVEILPEGLRTKGDGNDTVDEWTVAPEWIVGKVVRARRARRWRPVRSGFRGAMRARLQGVTIRWRRFYRRTKLKSFVRRQGLRVESVLSLLLRRSDRFRRLVAGRLRVVLVEKAEGERRYLLWRDRVVGDSLQGSWRVEFPFTFLAREPEMAKLFGLAEQVRGDEEA